MQPRRPEMNYLGSIVRGDLLLERGEVVQLQAPAPRLLRLRAPERRHAVLLHYCIQTVGVTFSWNY